MSHVTHLSGNRKWRCLMDKSDVVREITIRMMGGDANSFKTKEQKVVWYSALMNVSEVVNHIEALRDAGLLEFEIKRK